MDISFTIILNEASTDSWPDIVWRDAQSIGANVLLDSCLPLSRTFRKLRKIHFSNLANHKIWLPMKCLWDKTNTLRLSDLDPSKRNYIIFQTGIKFSANYIARLKKERNACIVLYMPDNIRTMKMASNKSEFERFCKHYHVDQVYSFDHKDCEEFGVKFFDFYSMLSTKKEPIKQVNGKMRVLYVGGCRSMERLKTLHAIYDKLRDIASCTFYINGVAKENATREGVVYNHPLSYADVVELVQQNDIIVEIMNGSQVGNTLRLKEAVCYNKCLLSNNKNIISSPYYNPAYMQMFDSVDEININIFSKNVNYNYRGEFSPKLLMNIIVEEDLKRKSE
jgi:hypothetical protein